MERTKKRKEQDLLFDLGGGAFCGLQVLHQFCVAQEVPRSRGQTRQQVVLQRFQSDLETVLLLRQIGLRNTETHTKKLFFI